MSAALRCGLIALMLGSGCARDLLEITSADSPAALTLTWSVRAAAQADFAARVAELRVDVRSSADNQSMLTASTPVTTPGEALTLPAIAAKVDLRIVVSAHSSAGDTIYLGEAERAALLPGESAQQDVALNGLPASLVVEVRGQAGDVTVVYNLQDPEGDPCDLLVEYRGGRSGVFFGAASVDSASVSGVTPDTNLELVWRSAVDEPDSIATVALRVTPDDGDQGFASESATFQIDNKQLAPDVPDPEPMPVVVSSAQPELCWSDETASVAAAYHLQVSTAADFTALVVDDPTLTATCYTPASPLGEGTYYWRVASVRISGATSAFSATQVLEVDQTPPAVPALLPLASPRTADVVPYTWTAASDSNCAPGAAGARCAVRYRFQVSQVVTFSPLLVNEVVDDTSFAWTPPAVSGGYHYRVAAIDAANLQSAFSGAEALDIDAQAPPFPILNPFVPAVTNQTQPTLSWIFSGGDVDHFSITISAGAAFDGSTLVIAHDTASAPPTSQPSAWMVDPPLAGDPRTTYWATITAHDRAGNSSPPSAPISFEVDTTTPTAPATCTVDAATCFQGSCSYLGSPKVWLLWDKSMDPTWQSYRIEIFQDTGQPFVPARVVSNIGAALLEDLGGQWRYELSPPAAFATGTLYYVQLQAVNDAGGVSPGRLCTMPGGPGDQWRFDLGAPPPPTLLGAYVPAAAQQVGPPDTATARIYFLPPASSGGAGQSPIWGYVFAFRYAGEPSDDRCGLARVGLASGPPASACSQEAPAVLSAYCPASPSAADPCIIDAAAMLVADSDRIYDVQLRAVDEAGNESALATLGTDFSEIAVDEVYADAVGPNADSVWPEEPTECADFARYGADDTSSLMRFRWLEPAQRPAKYLFTIYMGNYPWGSNCSNDSNYWCRRDLFEESPGVWRVCTSTGSVPMGGGGGSSGPPSCVGSTGTTCLRPLPTGACEPEFQVRTGWSCQGSMGPCLYQEVIDSGTETFVLMPDTEGQGFSGDEVFWWVYGVDAAGNRAPVQLSPPSSVPCPGGCGAHSCERTTRFAFDAHQANDHDAMAPAWGTTVSGNFMLDMNLPQRAPEETLTLIVEIQEIDSPDGISGTPLDVVWSKNLTCPASGPIPPDCPLPWDSNWNLQVSPPLPDGYYRWRFRVEDDMGNASAWRPCFAPGIDDGVELCDDWALDPMNADVMFEVTGGLGNGGAATPAPLWPPDGAVCSAPELVWTGVVNADGYELELFDFYAGTPFPSIGMSSPYCGAPPCPAFVMPYSPSDWPGSPAAYYYRVRAVLPGPSGPTVGDWSEARVIVYDTGAAATCAAP